ncbi:MAG TPA: hypothetical protein VFE78_10165 [Gemmataceae bacterium]|jgi:hypothetical protein|nr:hypothetical protein [Gemmataceae bacterium]
MELEWQQKQLLKLLDDLDATGPESCVLVQVKSSDGGEYLHLQGSRTAQDGEGLDVDKKYPTRFVYPLRDEGLIGLQPRDGGLFGLWINPEGVTRARS